MQTFTVHKPAVHSRHGLVAGQNRHAAEAGAAVLARGGNAMDAAIVTALVLSVVEPWLSGIGGGGFLLHADGQTGAVDTLDFNVLAPRGLNPADYPLVGGNDGDWFNWPAVQGNRNVSGYGSICVPGAIAGFASALEKYGTLSWADALQPAIEHATQGLELDWFTCLTIAIDAAGLAQDPASAALFLDEGRAPRASDRTPVARWPLPDTVRLLQRLAQGGAREFYEGDTARALARDLEAGGSALRFDDFANYQPVWAPPLVGHYRGHPIQAMPGLSGGPTFLEACAALTASALGPTSSNAEAALIHATAIRAAYAQRLTTMGHAATADAGCTSHVSVVDASGSRVSLTNPLLSRFGAKVVMPGAGFLMNNGMMWFDPRPGQPNSMAAGAKPLANMCPLILQRDGRPWLAIGAAGGRTIFPTVLQLVSGLLDRGLSLEDAFNAPRLDASTATIKVDQRAGPEVAAAVASRFPVELVQDTVYPVHFAIPSAVLREAGHNQGMAHTTSPWAAVAVGGLADGA
jgi:gamma-glutamyltranspeptidase/glutathione hydrolase